MKSSGCGALPVDAAAAIGGVAAADCAALDELAVKLICLDGGFAVPLRQVGCIVGKRIAGEQGVQPITFEAALSAMISACGLDGVIKWRFIHHSADEARLEISGCSEALGWPIPHVARTVCGFDAGLFEGFLNGATGDGWSVEETNCLGLGHSSCQFVIQRARRGEAKGAQHGGC